MRPLACAFVGLTVTVLTQPAEAQTERARAGWIALAKSGFTLPDGAKAIDRLVEMNALLASTDPVLRDDVAFSGAERWIVRDGRVAPDELRRLLELWSANLQDGLDTPGDDRIFKRSFSALCLSLIAARDLTAPFLEAGEMAAFFDRMLESADTVFTWGENDRMALALQSIVRRADAVPANVDAWTARWLEEYKALWANGPRVDPKRFARVENARQVMRSLHAALSMEASPTSNGDTARKALLAGLGKMR